MEEYVLSPYVFYYQKGDFLYLYNSENGLKTKIFNKELINFILQNSKKVVNSVPSQLLDYKIFVLNNGIYENTIKEIKKNIETNNTQLRLIILPTRNCNFKCKYCYEQKSFTMMSKKTQDNLINATINYIKSNHDLNKVHLEWFGGEPLLAYDSIIYISSSIKKFCDDNGINLMMSMTTNGSLLTFERFKELYSLNLKNYQITIDGFPQYHNRLRPFINNSSSSFDVIMHNLEEIKKFDKAFEITLRMNYYLDMLDSFDDYFEYISNKFDYRFSIYPYRINPPSEKFALEFEPVDATQEKYVLKHYFSLLKSKRIQMKNFSNYFIPYGSVCYGRLNYSLVIDVDGSIRKCTEYLEDNHFNYLGNITDGYFNVDNNLIKLWSQSPNIENNKCVKCSHLPNCCGGICPIQWIYNNNVSCPTFYEIEKEALDAYFSVKEN